MKTPNILTVENVLRAAREVQCQLPDGRYVPARSEGWGGGLYGLRISLKAAWMVFTGRADALVWEQQS